MLNLDPYFELSDKLIRAWKRGHKFVRTAMVTATVLVVAAICTVVVGKIFGFSKPVVETIAGSMGAIGGILTLVVLAYEHSLRSAQLQTKLEEVERRVEEHPDEPQAAWELAQLKLETYLNRNLNQVRSIYWLTVTVSIIGFALIIYGVVQAYADAANFNASVLTAVSGVVVNFIGASFLVIYRSTIAQAKDYVTVLERINAVGMAIQVLEALPESEEKLRSATTAELAKEMLKMYGVRTEKKD